MTDAGEMEEGLAEELRAQLSKPTFLFAFRNISGTIDPGENNIFVMQDDPGILFQKSFSVLRRMKYLL